LQVHSCIVATAGGSLVKTQSGTTKTGGNKTGGKRTFVTLAFKPTLFRVFLGLGKTGLKQEIP
jgi:hypothetical protein